MHRIHYEKGKFAVADLMFALMPKDKTELDAKFLYYLLSARLDQVFVPLMKGTANVGLKLVDALAVEIPLPTIEQQHELALECDRLNTLKYHAEGYLSNWSVDLYPILEGDEIALNELAEVDAKIIKDLMEISGFRYVGGEHIESGTGRLIANQTVAEAGIIGPSYTFKAGQLVYSKVRPNLRKCFFAEFDGVCSSDIYPYTIKSERVDAEYLALVMASDWFAKQTHEFQERAGMPKINRDQLAAIRIIVPPIEEQQKCVKRYKAGRLIVDGLEANAEMCRQKALGKVNAIWEL